jgi:hypothetical protein
MTNNDHELIKQAEYLNPIHWGQVSSLIEQADTSEAMDELKSIETTLYHTEEGMSDLL